MVTFPPVAFQSTAPPLWTAMLFSNVESIILPWTPLFCTNTAPPLYAQLSEKLQFSIVPFTPSQRIAPPLILSWEVLLSPLALPLTNLIFLKVTLAALTSNILQWFLASIVIIVLPIRVIGALITIWPWSRPSEYKTVSLITSSVLPSRIASSIALWSFSKLPISAFVKVYVVFICL